MNIKFNLEFQYQFFINLDDTARSTFDEGRKIKIEIDNWAKENCSGLWMLADYTKCRFQTVAKDSSPIPGKSFSIPEISGTYVLVMFAEEEDNVAFKLKFSGE